MLGSIWAGCGLTICNGDGFLPTPTICNGDGFLPTPSVQSGIDLRGVSRVSHLSVPPWQLIQPSVDASLSETKKGELPAEVFRAEALQHIASFTNHTSTYTDGSKTDQGVGCAFVSGDTTRSFTLPGHASVFTSELVALVKALSYIEVGSETLHLILTDSLSALLALRTFYPQNPLVQDILKRLTALDQAGKEITLCWIPSHVGILGNELADAAAKRATRTPYSRRFPLPAKDFYHATYAFMHRKWQHTWEELDRSKLREIKPVLARWQSGSRKSRIEEVVLCRLRIGHTYSTHGYLLCGEDQPLCSYCNTLLTVRHVLLECPQYTQKRVRHLGRLSPGASLCQLLGNDSNAVQTGSIFSFLSAVGFRTVYSPQ